MATDPRSWIYGFLDRVPGIIAAPARWIADRIFGIFDDGVEFARWVKSGVDHLSAWGIALLATLRVTLREMADTIGWLVTIRIPQLLANTAASVRAWATSVISTAINGVKGIISTLDKWAKKAISTVTNALTQVRDWLLGKINAITDRLRKTIDLWYDRMTNPAKMAEWLIGALVGPFWRYVYANRDKIARWFVNKSPAFTEWLARELDSILKRIL